jgi:hypothetical protein
MVGDPTAVAAMKRLKSLSRELLHIGEGRQEESSPGRRLVEPILCT